ncbi:MAG: fused signal recognition particle receptor [Acidimicrobiales bacterium]|jgi:fused signal recognition particle receptor
MDPIVVVLIVIAVLAAVGGIAFVSVRRRGPDLELEPRVAATDTLDAAREDVALDESVVVDAALVDAALVDAALADAALADAALAGDRDVEDVVVEETVLDESLVKPSFFDRLGKARSAFTGYLGGLVGLGKVDDAAWEDLEEALIRADVGVQTSMSLIEDVRNKAKETDAEDGAQVLELLKERMRSEIAGKDRSLTIDDGKVNVWLFVGVNGVGKTTTIGKLGLRLSEEGHRPLMAAGDTFRAAAAEQLTVWAERSDCEIVRGNEGGDPSSVIFDGIQAAGPRNCDVVLADTAGRLHNKSNLMDELSKVRRVAGKEPGHVSEVLLVLDATTGQNGMTQAKVFAEAVEVTGVVLTKLDGSAKGGIVFAIESELGIPVKLVGLGEGIEDLVDFDPDEFIDALFE